MGKLTCGCLNVKIHSKKDKLALYDVGQPGVTVEPSEDFFKLEISEAQVDLEGIRIEHPYLVKKHVSSDWLIHQCCNCEMYTHATCAKQSSNKILVNLSLKSDPTIIERLEQCPDFSPLYKIVLRSRDDNHPVQTLGLKSGKYESIQETLNSVQEELNTFLSSEEAAMEERVRVFEEQQRGAYSELQSKVRRDKNAMISVVLKAVEQDAVKSSSGAATESVITPAQPVLPKNQAKTAIKKTSAPTTANAFKTAKVVSARQTSAPVTGFFPVNQSDDLDMDSQAMFDLEGMHDDDSRPFYISDDENEDDTDDSSLNDEAVPYSSHHSALRHNMLSSSVPVSIPHWRMASGKRNVSEEEEDEDDDDRNHGDIAASIKALARSVHGDGTEMFGDLPRPRINTMDMGNV